MPRKHCSTRVRSRGKAVLTAISRMVKFYAYDQPPYAKWQDWKFRTISLREAERLEKAGEAERIIRQVDGEVRTVGFRAKTPTSWEKPSPCTLTLSTMIAVGNREPGNSEARLSQSERRHVEKFIAWPLIGDTKAVAVRPRLTDAERSRAQKMLNVGYLAKAA